MDKIQHAVLALQYAFEAEGLALPSVVLGAEEDKYRLMRRMKAQDLVLDPTLQRARLSIAGTQFYCPGDLRREFAQAGTATLSRSRLND